jgi:ATP-dependent DNA helicase DinG
MPKGKPASSSKDFEPGGALSKALPGFEPRAAQAAMAVAVEDAFASGASLLVEAGTGVGKSLAYLLPGLRRALEGQGLLLSTATLTLQDQLLKKDLPAALRALGAELDPGEGIVRAMGRSNYFCRLRFELLEGPQSGDLFEGHPSSVQKLKAWSLSEPEPTRDRLNFAVEAGLWEKASVDAFGCPGSACPHARNCHFLKDRERLRRARVVVANHALLLSDVVARRERSALLPDLDLAVLDEAHHLERLASEHLGIRLGHFEFERALSPVSDPKTGKGLASRLGYPEGLAAMISGARAALHAFFEEAQSKLRAAGMGSRQGMEWPAHILTEGVSTWLLDAAGVLKKAAESLSDEGLATECKATAQRLENTADTLKAWVSQSLPEHLYWLEPQGRKGELLLRSAPLKAGEALALELYPRFSGLVLTSATLATDKGLDFSRARLGLPDDTKELVLDSPFDYSKQVQLHLTRRPPDPRKDEAGYLHVLEEEIKAALTRSHGRAFVLFTSFRHLEELESRLKDWIEEQGWLFLSQAGRAPREKMLERFRASGQAVLFGVASFWEGVDIPGEALSSVIITRLPFTPPDSPLEKARARMVEEAGGSPFSDLSLPEAVLRLKQGFGRLIRHSADSGSIVLLDPRLLSASYGKAFLRALPRCRVFVDGVEEEAYT